MLFMYANAQRGDKEESMINMLVQLPLNHARE